MLIEFEIVKEKVLKMLTLHSNPVLAYHSVYHTMDVLCNAERIASEEGLTDGKKLLLLKLAALYHDTGFLFVYKGHEEKSCEIARKDLANSAITPEEMNTICSMIMATRVPQSPKNHLEEILCDADLDYLGRDDFELISDNLRKEYFDLGFIKTEEEWTQVQIKFIGSHEYFTKASRIKRNIKKCKHLKRLRAQVDVNITNKEL